MPPISIYCDSEDALSRTYNHIYNGKSIHIEFRHNIIRQYN